MFIDDLKTINILEGLTEEEYHDIFAIAHSKKLAEGEYLFREEGLGEMIYLLDDGTLEITVNSSTNANEKMVLAEINQKCILGEFNILENAPWSVSAQATTPVKFLEIHSEDIYDLFEKNNKIGMVILQNLGRILSSRIRNADIELFNSLVWTEIGSPTEE